MICFEDIGILSFLQPNKNDKGTKTIFEFKLIFREAHLSGIIPLFSDYLKSSKLKRLQIKLVSSDEY